MARPTAVSSDEVAAGLTHLHGWTGDPAGIERVVEAPSFLSGVRLVTDVARIAEEMDHHPDIDLRWRTLHLALVTHSAGGVTENDLALARRIDALLPG